MTFEHHNVYVLFLLFTKIWMSLMMDPRYFISDTMDLEIQKNIFYRIKFTFLNEYVFYQLHKYIFIGTIAAYQWIIYTMKYIRVGKKSKNRKNYSVWEK